MCDEDTVYIGGVSPREARPAFIRFRLVFVGASDGGVYDGAARTITWVVNLTKGGSKVFYVNVTVKIGRAHV